KSCTNGKDDDCDKKVDCKDPSCSNFKKCRNSPTTTLVDGCRDTDGGDNYFKYGIAIKGNHVETDSCGNNNYLSEAVCQGGPSKVLIQCPFKCSQGRCLRPPTTTLKGQCTETDYGEYDYFKRGVAKKKGVRRVDTCSTFDHPNPVYGQMLLEASCITGEPKWFTYNCPNGCKRGACLLNPTTTLKPQPTTTLPYQRCRDSDGGMNLLVHGGAVNMNNGIFYVDGCSKKYDNMILEAYCYHGYDPEYSMTTFCPTGHVCDAGVCAPKPS
ncbi:MAG: hypothetical protein ABIH11_02575, partial [Candidatus Altiarchaeota archaeon]